MRTEAEAGEFVNVRLPIFLEQGFSCLEREVVAERVCCLCGTCAAFCEKIKINEESRNELKPEFVEEYDTVCGLCYAFCPRTFLPFSELERRIFGVARASEAREVSEAKEESEAREASAEPLGVYRSCYAVRSKKEKGDLEGRVQDGGAVTSLLAYALEEGVLDSAVVTAADEQWRPQTRVARSHEDLKAAAGTKYTIYPSVLGVKEAFEEGCESVGFVGLPCQIQGLRKVQTSEQPYEVGKEKIKLLVGLFCMENFSAGLLEFVSARLEKEGLDLAGVKKFDIKGKELLISGGASGGVHKIALDEIKEYESEGCSVCTDYTAELADISVGSVGSEEGWSTVLARTELGEEVVKGALEKGFVEVKEVEEKGLGLVRRLAVRKKRSGSGGKAGAGI